MEICKSLARLQTKLAADELKLEQRLVDAQQHGLADGVPLTDPVKRDLTIARPMWRAYPVSAEKSAEGSSSKSANLHLPRRAAIYAHQWLFCTAAMHICDASLRSDQIDTWELIGAWCVVSETRPE